MNTYVAIYSPGRAWQAGKTLKEQPLKEHVDYLLRLHRNGAVLMGGPLADGSGGMVVFSATDRAAAEKLVTDDPAVINEILQAEIKQWSRIV